MAISVEVGANVAPFKSAMAEAAASAKTLDAAMKANEKQLKATGNEEQYLQQKAQLLSSAMSAQQAIAKNAEQALAAMAAGGVSATSVAYQQMQAKMLTAYGAMNDIQAQMTSMEGAATEAAASTDTLSTSVENIGKKMSLDQVISGIEKVTSVMERAGKAAIEFGRNLWSLMSDSADWADDLATNASMWGMSTEELQRRQYVSQFIDTTVESIVKSRNKLATNMKYGSEDAMDVFALLGIKTNETTYASTSLIGPGEEIAGKLRDWEDVFWETGAALIALGDNAETESMSMKVFGKSWDELKPLFRMSEEDFEKYGSARERYAAKMAEAPIVSDEDVNKLGALDDAMAELESQFTVMKESVFATLAPAFTEISNGLSSLMEQFNQYLQTDEGKEYMEGLGNAVKSLFEGIGDIDFSQAIETVKGAITGLKDALEWIKKNEGVVTGALAAIASSFAGLKISEGVLTFVQLVNGGKGLFAKGGAGAAGAAAANAAGAAGTTAAGGGFGGALRAGLSFGGKVLPFALPVALAADGIVGIVNDTIEGYEVGQSRRDMFDTLKTLGFGNDKDLGAYWEEMGASLLSPDSGVSIFDRMKAGFDAMLAMEDGNEWFEGLYNILPDYITDAMESIFADVDTNDSKWQYSPDLKTNFIQELFNSITTDIGDGIEIPTELNPDMASLQTMLNNAGFSAPVTMIPVEAPESNANGISFVPRDNYLTYLHKGERVMTAAANRQFTANSYFNVGVMNMNDGLDADSLAARVADQNRATMNGFGSR